MKDLSLLSLDTAMKEKMKEVRKGYKKKGFFSIEFAIIIVVALILLAAYLYKSSSLVNSANHTSAMRDMDSLRTAILIYQTQTKTGQAPAKLDDLLTGVTSTNAADGKDHAALIDGSKRGNKIVDPWGNEYTYTLNTDKVSGSITCTEGGSGTSTIQF